MKQTCPECNRTHKRNSRALERCRTEAEWLLGHLVVLGEFDGEPTARAKEARSRANRFAKYEATL